MKPMVEVPIARHLWLDYWRRYREFRVPLALSGIMAVTQSLLLIPQAFLIKAAFDSILGGKGFLALCVPCGLILTLTLVSAALSLLARHNVLRVSKLVIEKIRLELLLESYGLAATFSSAEDRSWIHTVIVQDTERVDIGTSAIFSVALPALVTSAIFFAALFVLAPRLLVATLCAAPLAILSHRFLGRPLQDLVKRFRAAFEAFDENILQALRRVELTRVRGAQAYEMARQGKFVDALRLTSGRMAWMGMAYSVAQASITTVVSVVTLIVGGMAVARGAMSLSDLAAYYFVLAQLGASLNALWTATPQILAGADSLGKIGQMQAMARRTPVGGTSERQIEGDIEFRDVHFSHGEGPLLRGVNLRVPAGGRIAIVGPNGAGKSTLAYLLLGLFAPEAGDIFVDGVSLSELSLEHYRRQIGVVLQDAFLFPGTIAENIAYGRTSPLREDIEHAAMLARADVLLQGLPQGYDTEIGLNGVALSGGQAQTLGLARALYGRPKLLILDEPTNHLDADTVQALLERLDTLESRPTLVLITHDRAVASRFDRVYRLEGGVLAEADMLTQAKFRLVGGADA
jgi:ABC-type multidrug transport system fused ATPase/permease subunit